MVEAPQAPSVGPTMPAGAGGSGGVTIPPEVVAYLGTGFFDKLIAKTLQEISAGAAAPGPWDELSQDAGGETVPGGMTNMPPRLA